MTNDTVARMTFACNSTFLAVDDLHYTHSLRTSSYPNFTTFPSSSFRYMPTFTSVSEVHKKAPPIRQKRFMSAKISIEIFDDIAKPFLTVEIYKNILLTGFRDSCGPLNRAILLCKIISSTYREILKTRSRIKALGACDYTRPSRNSIFNARTKKERRISEK